MHLSELILPVCACFWCWNFKVVSWMYPLLHILSPKTMGNQQQTTPHSPGRLHCLVPGALLWKESDLLPLLPPSTSQIPIQSAHPQHLLPSPCTNLF